MTPDIHALVETRTADYGGQLNLDITAAAWQAYLDGKKGRALTARDVCWMMTLLKAMRDAHQYKDDNVADGLGYLTLADDASTQL